VKDLFLYSFASFFYFVTTSLFAMAVAPCTSKISKNHPPVFEREKYIKLCN